METVDVILIYAEHVETVWIIAVVLFALTVTLQLQRMMLITGARHAADVESAVRVGTARNAMIVMW